MDEEARLIKRVQKNGDRAAADTLVRRYYDEIFRYVLRQTADKNTALDLTQDIFLSALKSLPHYEGKQAGFRTWLFKIATNKTVDHYRSRAVRARHILDADRLDFPDGSDLVRQAELRDFSERLRTHINALPADLQQIFRLKFYGDCTFPQIAALLKMPEATVKSKYYRLLNQLRKEFKDEYD
ncbi:MAG TPA: RNA polymerase sigma factor [Clostridia bacterium]|nr:RNA polymerase sigma factor [Clostridia bacterium]